MTKPFIAELHDIGKLVDDQVKKQIKSQTGKAWQNHVFINFDFDNLRIKKPTSPSWWGQYHHNIDVKKDINDWNDIDKEFRPDLFLLKIADNLASSVARVLPPLESAGESEGILKLWNQRFYENEKSKGKHWAVFKTDQDLKELFKTIDRTNSPEELLEKYRENLLLTPEDRAKPRNITSLYTHVELVGKIYRVLRKHFKIEKDVDSKLWLIFQNEKTNNIFEVNGDGFIYYKDKNQKEHSGNKKGKWQARFLKCWIKFPHSFVRLQDINLLVKREELIESFVNKNKDYVMFASYDFLTLFLPIEVDVNNMFTEFLNYEFFIEIIETIADLGILNSNLDKKTLKARETNDSSRLNVLNNRQTKVYKKVLMANYSLEISSPICDICQMQPAKERIKENIREWICDKCYEIRESGESFKYPEEWYDSKIIWLKFNLNQDKLEKWLQKAFNEYIDSLTNLQNKDVLKDLKEEFRSLACQADFVIDYKDMLSEFWSKNTDIKKPISSYNELGVCEFSGNSIKKIIKSFLEIHHKFFSECIGNNDSPISLSLSISHIKYPIREHFRYFENPKGFLNIRSHNAFENTYAKEEIKWLIDKLSETSKESLHFLYKLLGLYNELNSEINITIEILNNKDRHPLIYNLYCKFETSPEKILNFFRIIEGKDEIDKA